jgi:hypothetical protein
MIPSLQIKVKSILALRLLEAEFAGIADDAAP